MHFVFFYNWLIVFIDKYDKKKIVLKKVVLVIRKKIQKKGTYVLYKKI